MTHLAHRSVASAPQRPTPAPRERGPACAALLPRELAVLLEDPSVRILDVRRRVLSVSGGSVTIPGAIRLHPAALAGPHGQQLSTLELAYTMSRAGVGDHHRVVFLDEDGRSGAARLASVLHGVGHGTASSVDGGWRRWDRERLPTAGDWTVHPPESFTARVEASLGALPAKRGGK